MFKLLYSTKVEISISVSLFPLKKTRKRKSLQKGFGKSLQIINEVEDYLETLKKSIDRKYSFDILDIKIDLKMAVTQSL